MEKSRSKIPILGNFHITMPPSQWPLWPMQGGAPYLAKLVYNLVHYDLWIFMDSYGYLWIFMVDNYS